jgi:hypothetical protein
VSDKRFDRIEEKLDKIDARMDAMASTLIINTEQLKYHIKRTDILEEQVEPIADHVVFIRVALRWVGVLAVLAGLAKAAGLI